MAEAGIEIPFKAKNINPEHLTGGMKAAQRKDREKERWHSELIRFEVQHEDGEIDRFRLPRRKCDARRRADEGETRAPAARTAPGARRVLSMRIV